MSEAENGVVTRQVQSSTGSLLAASGKSRDWSSGVCSCLSDCRSCKSQLQSRSCTTAV